MHGPDGWGSFAAVPNMIAEILPQLREAAPVILSLIIIEGLLSVDNMLAIATLASQLPEKQKKLALRTGLAGAYVFRGVALFFVGFIMANEWIKFLGAFYLIHLMAEHFSDFAAATDDDPETKPHKPRTFWPTVIAIQLMDLSLSVDNVVAAVALGWFLVLAVLATGASSVHEPTATVETVVLGVVFAGISAALTVTLLDELGVPIGNILHGEQSFTYLAQVCAGDVLKVDSRIADIYQKKGGALEFIVKDSVITDQNGVKVIEARSIIVARNPKEKAA